MDVLCDVKLCRVKVEECKYCPLLSKEVSRISNIFVKKKVKFHF